MGMSRVKRTEVLTNLLSKVEAISNERGISRSLKITMLILLLERYLCNFSKSFLASGSPISAASFSHLMPSLLSFRAPWP